jgi:long-chain acyl-CoA synthetase
MERAKRWGWPNTYTYTKSLGEQVCAAADVATGADHVRCCIVRPAIVESAVRYPMVGWNEGFTTTAPLAMLTLLGHRSYPLGDKHILDLIPVDLVAAGLIQATAATIDGSNDLVYQLCSGDENPFWIRRCLELLGLYKRRYFLDREAGPRWLNVLRSRLEPVKVSREAWRSRSAPRLRSITDTLIKAIDEHTPKWGAPRIAAMAEHARQKISDVRDLAHKTEDAVELFMPFIHDRKYIFRADRTRALHARLADADQRALPWDPEAIDWRHYWLDIHMPGLEKWVFPSLEEEFQAKPKSVYTYKDLLELFDATTKHHRQRTAMRQLPPVDKEGRFHGEPRRYTYGDLQELASRGAAILRERGVTLGDKVLLVSENRPEWGIAYFAILKAGASAVPVDANASGDEILNLSRSARVKLALIADRSLERLERDHGFTPRDLDVERVSFADLLEHEPRVSPFALVARPKADDLASLIFTSGTTGRPKGVMLSHRNFSSLLSKLGSVFDIDRHDMLLSVLPLHHTLEFTAGLLMPLMRGGQVSYLDEVNAESLTAAFDERGVTGMVGVPALWQLLHRRITRPFAERGPLTLRAFEAVVDVARGLRDKLPQSFAWLNLGRLVFYPVHRRFGGRLRLMISGASALPVDTMKMFRGLGFGFYEGYGLTEAAPVLTVTRPGQRLIAGSVGEPLPGIDVKIDSPDARGVGEVIASGPNVMAGYYEDAESTADTIRGGWLHTGDLGRIEDGRLFIVGRKKEMILGASGENVYPDELEEVYRDSPSIKELSIVGLPSDGGSGEIVACLVVPDYGDGGLARDEVRHRVREHFRGVSGKLPNWKRVKVLHTVDHELPKTATRKVKRKLVVEELKKLERLKAKGESARKTGAAAPAIAASGAQAAGGVDAGAWLRGIVAEVTGQPAGKVVAEAQLVDLGFDSLTYTELGVALEAAGLHVPEQVDLTGVATVAELEKLVATWGGKHKKPAPASAPPRRTAATGKRRSPEAQPGEAEEIPVPEFVADWGSDLLDLGQRMLYERYLDMRVTGRAHLPGSSHFLVAANHTSHLDMGLVKMALGEWGSRLVALAAKDYFFEDPVRRAYFENFTNLVPMERHGSLRESLRLASDVMRQGYVLLIFPEGTRSETGTMSDFKPSIGYLSLANKIDVLPMYLAGTHDAMPKGALLPKRGHVVSAHIGPVITWQALKQATAGLPRSEHYREAARIVEEAVRKLAPRGSVDRRAVPRVQAGEAAPDAGGGDA